MTLTYQQAGVNIAAGNEAVNRIKKSVASTYSSHVVSEIGGFAALYDLKEIMKNYHHPILVQSIDGVGTKMMVANKMQRYTSIGRDVVSATVNDILVIGAKPLTLLDYIANDCLQPAVIEMMIEGMVQACCENNIALVGGEMAEMPGTYQTGEYDLVGVITGIVEKDKMILGKTIKPGDVVLALPASGLHTNGYSLVRKLLFEVAGFKVESILPELQVPLGEVLLIPHVNYTQPVHALLSQEIEIKGMAHITGGGVLENIPRVLPPHCSVTIKKNRWPILPIFNVLADLGQLPERELYKTFNMGIGFILIVAPENIKMIRETLSTFAEFPVYEIGEVIPGHREVVLI